MDSLKEILPFLQLDQRIDLKAVSLTHILGLTGTPEGIRVLLDFPEIVYSIFRLTEDKTPTIAKDAVLCLINLTADENGASKVAEISEMFNPAFNLVGKAINTILDENSELADPWTMVLSNLSRVESLVVKVLIELKKDQEVFLKLIKAFAKLDYNKKKCKLHYLGPIFCNLTQNSEGRTLICDPELDVLQKIIPFTSFEESIIRRGGSLGILKNICFDPVYHDVILNEKDDILFCLLYPLAGPEEFTDEENEKFPIELQYLGEEKKREEDPDLRRMILESLLQLCATKKYREFLRSKGTYEILREYHKWEANVGKDKNALLACENVVDILIKKEEEIAIDNLKTVEVPEDIGKKFVEDDENYLKDD